LTQLISIPFAALLAEALLLIQDLGLDLFTLLLGFRVLSVIGFENLVLDLLEGYIVFPIQVLVIAW